ncbi:MAG TPA: YkyA family protein [Gammaproteobacteria bacterium]|nr:YkyA family protein [Gammaproteobacteria bacterium]
MKSKFRIASLVLGLGLAGVVTAAWGAESVINLISAGETIISNVKTTKARQKDVSEKNKNLAAEGPKLVEEQKQLQADIAAYQKQVNDVKALTDAYKTECPSDKRLTEDQFKACSAKRKQVTDAIAKVNAIPATLNKRQTDFNNRATAYNKETQDLKAEAPKASNAYTNALTKEENWIDQVRTFLLSPAVQPYAKKAGCPNVEKPAKDIEGVNKMSIAALACLKKIAGTG